jgi:hypothetical protein
MPKKVIKNDKKKNNLKNMRSANEMISHWKLNSMGVTRLRISMDWTGDMKIKVVSYRWRDSGCKKSNIFSILN